MKKLEAVLEARKVGRSETTWENKDGSKVSRTDYEVIEEGTKKLEKALGEFTVHSKGGQDILDKQGELDEVLDQWSEEMSEAGRKAVDAAKKAIEKAMAPVYKDLEAKKA